jgi:N6-adenosine-specific RNA methylase IME4
MQIQIDPELKALIPPLAPEELAQLEANIIKDGCRDPIVVWTVPPDESKFEPEELSGRLLTEEEIEESVGDVCMGWQTEFIARSGKFAFVRYRNPLNEYMQDWSSSWVVAVEGPEAGFLDASNEILIDGHNRYDICTRNNLPFETVWVQFENRDAAMDWMDANQLGRRNLTNDQRSILRGRRYNRTKKAPNRPLKNVEEVATLPERTAETIAKQHGVSERTIRSDGKKAEAIEKLALTNPEAAKAVTDGKKRFNEVRREIKLEEVKEAVKLPDSKYRVIYSDPPWKYGDQLTEDYGAIKFHYPAMTIAELCELPIKDMIEDDAVLFLWVTSPLLFECEPIIRAWGFKYKTSFVWDKIKHNMGHYNSVRHEFLLICTRGSCTPDAKQLFDSVQSIERTKHSAKPEEFRDIINTLYPHGKKLEMFARKEAPEGWDNWGNQSL